MGMNSPIPTDLAAECTKAAKILNKFIDPKEAGIDSVVPHDILTKAKGFAILTIIKAGFVWSGRAGSGLVVARLPDGSKHNFVCWPDMNFPRLVCAFWNRICWCGVWWSNWRPNN
ncbi:hypothetical protein DSO57_1027629 [Entomophthora muscae]|uniref:Uncharacterized protein n=1 Tax=Entomophthora muscae TaxID=34485 RepID=A0ACC2T274_9FUNG|nr:hypothetical protein DSO57_1027629 [Entomophthora muscae]